MTAPEKPRSRSWGMDDLEFGRQGQLYLKAIPSLILEKWVRENRQQEANYITRGGPHEKAYFW